MIKMLSILSIELFKIPGLFLTIGVILIIFAIVFFIIGNMKAKELPAKEEEDAAKAQNSKSGLFSFSKGRAH